MDGLDRLEQVAPAMFPIRAFLESSLQRDGPAVLRRRARSDGYLFARGLIDADLVRSLRARVLACAADFGWGGEGGATADPSAAPGGDSDSRWVLLQQRVFPAAEFTALSASVEILRLLETAVGPAEPTSAHTCRVFSPVRTDLTTGPHQDAFYLRSFGPFWTAWLPLEPCPLELGPLAVLRGSHRGGLRAHESGREGVVLECDPDRLAWRSGALAPGDVVLFDRFTLHRACPNRTENRLRFSVDFRFRILLG